MMSSMQNRSYQFGIFALLILTAAAAGSFAIIRLPIPLIAKILMVQAVVVCFFGWAVRNRKYPDPRLPQKPLTGWQIFLRLVPAMLLCAASLLLSLYSLLLQFKFIVL